MSSINKTFLSARDNILQAGKFEPGIPTNPDYERLSRLVTRIKSDPFIPKVIRDQAVDLLGNRAEVIIQIHLQELQAYCNELAKGKFSTLEDSEAVVHNRVLDELRRRGCGIAEIEEEVHKLRLAIQEYFEKFHPERPDLPFELCDPF